MPGYYGAARAADATHVARARHGLKRSRFQPPDEPLAPAPGRGLPLVSACSRLGQRRPQRLVLPSFAFIFFVGRDVMQLQEETTEPTDYSLVLAAQQGDREAFGELAPATSEPSTPPPCAGWGTTPRLQEVCQEVLVRAMQKISQLREPEAFGAWLQAVANRMAINRAVRKRSAAGHRAGHAGRDVRRGRNAAVASPDPRATVAGPRRFGPAGRLDRETLVAFYVEGQSLSR